MGGAFVCAPAAVPEGGGTHGAPCEFTNACMSGLYCGYAEGVCPEDSAGCCLPFCDLVQPECPDALSCVPAFEPGHEPPGLEHVGVCTSAG